MEDKMQYLFKCLFLMFIISKLVMSNSIGYAEICIVLIIAASNIVREKYIDSIFVIIFEFIIITIGITLYPAFSAFYGIICYDLVAKKKYLGVLLTIACAIYLLDIRQVPDTLLTLGVCSLLSYLNSGYKIKSELLKLSFDKERQYSHELELTKVKLMNSSADAAHIAEVNERNRIAREIHDNIGHSIAGVLMLLQASFKLYDRDNGKSKELVEKSIHNLSEGLTLLKNTVYNLKPNANLGIDYILEIVNNFSFCKIDFKYIGNFNNLDAGYVEILGTNIKEALTNASKYSEATLVEILIEINENYLRLYIKDNGVGCHKIKESLGLSGMRERIKNSGGNISINGEEGFLVVCVIPLKREVGAMFEGSNS
jgi:signal transduction histidine kinase